MKFKKIKLEAFRAYESSEFGTFDFTLADGNASNFISIYGPNGFGKTSIYDAVEWCITNNINRLKEYDELAKDERKEVTSVSNHREKQHILKNRNASESAVGKVTLDTTKKEFIREIPVVPRAGSKDYSFDDKKTENKYFQDVILSQEGIDSFLRKEDSKERYKSFINYFGNESDSIINDNLEKLIKRNNRDIDELNEAISNLILLIDNKQDVGVLEDVNSIIKKLNSNGEKITLIDEGFDEKLKLKLSNHISNRKVNLQESIEALEKSLNNLFDIKNEIKPYAIARESHGKLSKLFEHLKELEVLALQYDLLKANKSKVNLYEQKRKEIETYKDQSDKISIKLISLEKELNSKKIKLENKQSNLVALKVDCSDLKKSLNEIELIKKEFNLDDNINNTQFNQKQLRGKLSKCEENIIEQQNLIIDLNQQLNILENHKYENGRPESPQWSEIINVANKLKSLESELKGLNIKIDLTEKLSSDVKNLANIGIEVAKKNESSSCPLCSYEYESLEKLIVSIKKNQLLSDSVKEDLEKKDNILSEYKKYEVKHQEKFDILKNSLINQINKAQLKIDEDDKRRVILVSKLNKLLDKESQIVNIVGDKTLGQFIDEAKASIKSFESSIKLKINEITEIKGQINHLISQKKLLSESIIVHKESIENIKADSSYGYLSDVLKDKTSNEFYSFLKELESKKSKEIEKLQINFNAECHRLEFNELKLKGLSNLKNVREKCEIEIKEADKKISHFDFFRMPILGDVKGELSFDNLIYQYKTQKNAHANELSEINEMLTSYKQLENLLDNLIKYLEDFKNSRSLERNRKDLKLRLQINKKLIKDKEELENKINSEIEQFFHEKLINAIYQKIDPHPEYKKINFSCSFENGVGKLNVFVQTEDEKSPISPSLYFSTAQLNVLSLSIFLAKALYAVDDQGEPVNSIFIDDPIQSLDNINVLATIDLLRSFVVYHDKQIIISTHDENFHELLKKKIPTEYFESKFLRLETYGKVEAH